MRVMLFTAASLLAAACATFTPPRYQAAPDLGMEGYSEEALGEGKFRVSFAGAPNSNEEVVRDFAFLRASELTLREGADWFEVLNEESISRPEGAAAAFLSDSQFAPGAAFDRDNLGLGFPSPVQEGKRAPGEESDFRVAKFGHILEIQMNSGEPPENTENVYNAKAVSLVLFKRYNLDQPTAEELAG